ncbi:DUF4124 domain-containing protein [Luteimonas sp. XNQY3]|nr:DUF4124 domain-containing protein [Luteimonas sp. XNQY3]MCD9007010.1 DUF4124 domain-containing protein [Luteimonas sp. XNQY3]
MDTRRIAPFSRPARRMLAMLLGGACAVSASAAPPTPPQVTVYRCTDASGRVALRDSPCAEGATQEVRNMLRPIDGTPAPPRPTGPAAAVVDPPAPQVIVLRPPQPMYRCVRPDGSSYTSDSAEGNPRWVPLWTLGRGPPRRGPSTRVEVGDGRGSIEVDAGVDTRQRARGGYDGAGTWIRDACRQMPQGEVCSLLGNRREEIRRRFFNAQPTERTRLTNEERTINARLSQDCER